MSIASEITRLQSAKADLKTAIEGKGVTVPSDATLDDYADLVDSISGGGGDVTVTPLSVTENATYTAPTGTAYSPVTVNVQSGGGSTTPQEALKSVLENAGFVFVTFTPQTPASGNYFEVQHTLGDVPTDAIWFAKTWVNEDTPTCYLMGYVFNGNFTSDNEYNRTLQCFPSSTPAIANYVALLKSCGVTFIPWLKQTVYNASYAAATAQTVSVRNQSNNAAGKMISGDWYLGVR